MKMVRLVKMKMMRGETSTLVETISNMRLVQMNNGMRPAKAAMHQGTQWLYIKMSSQSKQSEESYLLFNFTESLNNFLLNFFEIFVTGAQMTL